ncbi:MAG: PorP/SprF family type IX secretion system membrane protein [Bacteroidota bacterium]
MKKLISHITLMLLLTVFAYQLNAQINYSRYEFTPLMVNPAEVSAGQYSQVSFSHRNTDLGNGVGLRSNLVSFLNPVVNKKMRKWAGIGFNLLEDQELSKNGFRHQEVNLSLAYNLQVAKNQQVSFGIVNGLHRNQLVTAGFTTGSQWVRNIGFDPTAGNGEQISEQSKFYHSVSSGLLWHGTDSRRRRVFELGGAVYHLNRPEVSFIDEQSRLDEQFHLQAGIRIVDQEAFSIYPSVLYRQLTGRNSVNAGATFSYYFQNDNPFNPISSGSLDVSARYLQDQGISVGVSLSQKNLVAGFTYNFPTSQIENSAFNNALEFHIVLRKPAKSSKPPVKTLTNYNLKQIRNLYDKNEDLIVRQDSKQADSLDIEAVKKRDEEVQTSLRFEFNQDLNFATGQANLDLKAKNYLNQMVNIMRGNQRLGLLIIGHTDNTGDLRVNEIVSEKRAEVVKEYLVSKGISARRIRTLGRAYLEPLVDNDSEENRLKNRRVEFVIYEKTN